MTIKQLIEALKKVKHPNAHIGFGVWFGDQNWKKGHTIFQSHCSPEIKVVNRKGWGKVAILGRADYCPMYSFNEFDSKKVQEVKP